MAYYNFKGDYISSDEVRIDEPYAPISLVSDRFNDTLARATEVLELLIGTDGQGGLIGEMGEALSATPSISINAPIVDTSMLLETSGLNVPVFDNSGMVSIPAVDVDFSGISLPNDITVAMSWLEANLPSEVYVAVQTQIAADLVDGSTGISESVETAIYTRARNRQQADNLAKYDQINNTIAQLQHAMPAGVSVALLADFGIGQARQEADLEAAIVETQARLAQENRKSAIDGAIRLDQLLRQTREGESTRALDEAKSLADLAVRKYVADIQAFQASWEGKRSEVQAKAENVRAAIETNKGFVDIFKAEAEAFGEAERAVGMRNESGVKLIAAKVEAADLELRAAIAEADATVRAFAAEGSIKEQLAASRAQISSHVAAALLSAVNASASIGYSGSESSSKGYSVSVSGNESHNVEHDPSA